MYKKAVTPLPTALLRSLCCKLEVRMGNVSLSDSPTLKLSDSQT